MGIIYIPTCGSMYWGKLQLRTDTVRGVDVKHVPVDVWYSFLKMSRTLSDVCGEARLLTDPRVIRDFSAWREALSSHKMRRRLHEVELERLANKLSETGD